MEVKKTKVATRQDNINQKPTPIFKSPSDTSAYAPAVQRGIDNNWGNIAQPRFTYNPGVSPHMIGQSIINEEE